MANNKHLTLNDRITIEKSIDRHLTFTSIGLLINKDISTISKEIRKHISCFLATYQRCTVRLSYKIIDLLRKLVNIKSVAENKYIRKYNYKASRYAKLFNPQAYSVYIN